MEWHLVKADKKRKKWTIRGPLWNGNIVKLPGNRDKDVATQMMENIASLSRSKQFGELPHERLADWINGLSENEAKRYIDLGLLDRRFIDKNRATADLLFEFKIELETHCKERSHGPQGKVVCISRVFAALGPNKKFGDLTCGNVTAVVKRMLALSGQRKGQSLSKKTQCEYLAAMKSFCAWMVTEKKAAFNPLEALDTSGAHSAPVRKRRPLSVEDFRQLASYLRTAPRKIKGQVLHWTPTDRLMIYWAAVMTGLRLNELRQLTPAHLNFNAHPATITVDGWISKNSHSTVIPIDYELARALKVYSREIDPHSRLFQFPKYNQLRYMFYRDLDAAGVRRNFDDGSRVDFHTLRSTAICWWLTENKLDLLKVQQRARLKTLELVQKYVDDYVPKHADLVHGAPEIFGESTAFEQELQLG